MYMDVTQFRRLRFELEELIDKDSDSLRFYNLGEKYKSKVQQVGAKDSYDIDDLLIL